MAEIKKVKGEKVIKIKGANKNVSKKFKTPKAALTYIEENNLISATKKKPMYLEIVQTSYQEIHLFSDELSKEVKESLIQLILNNIDKIQFYHPSLIIVMLRPFFKDRKPEIGDEFIQEYVRSATNSTEEDWERLHNLTWEEKREDLLYQEIYDSDFTKEVFKLMLSNVLKNVDVDELEFMYNQTDYTPCHNISVKIGSHIIQVRAHDLVFNGGYCYGRNTNLRKQFDLTDELYNKFKDNIVLS